MALLDGKPRSANVEIRENAVCYRLSFEDFEILKDEHPRISIVLLANISRTLSSRLRLADDIIMELEL
jgi:CRP-like cAMP-binding protein